MANEYQRVMPVDAAGVPFSGSDTAGNTVERVQLVDNTGAVFNATGGTAAPTNHRFRKIQLLTSAAKLFYSGADPSGNAYERMFSVDNAGLVANGVGSFVSVGGNQYRRVLMVDGAGNPLILGSVIDYNFRTGVLNGPALTTTRASTAYAINSDGLYAPVAANTARIEYIPNPNGVERQNLIRNNSMQGAVVGSPGTYPTNWSGPATSGNGLSQQIVSVGTEAGIDYIDLRVFGTPTATATAYALFATETLAGIAASSGQLWTGSAFFRLVGGSISGLSNLQMRVRPLNSGGTGLGDTSITLAPTGASLSSQRPNVSATLPANTTNVQLIGVYGVVSGTPVDFTLRIGLPQLERGSTATDPIRTTGSVGVVGPGNIGSRGLLVEGAQTNFLRNNSMQGASVGSPGTLPTNWPAFGTPLGLSPSVTSVGTVGGVEYIDIRFSGTSTGGLMSVNLENVGVIAAASGQLWTASSWVSLTQAIPGSVTNARLIAQALGTGQTEASFNDFTSVMGTWARRLTSVTLARPATTSIRIRFEFVTPAAGVDFTLRIGWPQLEQWSTSVTTTGGASSPIRTTGTAATRAADVVTATLASPIASPLTVATVAATPAYPVNFASIFQLGATSSEALLLRRNGSGQSLAMQGYSGGAPGAAPAGGSLPDATRFAAAGAFAVNDAALSVLGFAPATNTSTIAPGNMTALTVGGGVRQWNGYIERLAIYPSRLPNGQLQTLSTLAYWGG